MIYLFIFCSFQLPCFPQLHSWTCSVFSAFSCTFLDPMPAVAPVYQRKQPDEQHTVQNQQKRNQPEHKRSDLNKNRRSYSIQNICQHSRHQIEKCIKWRQCPGNKRHHALQDKGNADRQIRCVHLYCHQHGQSGAKQGCDVSARQYEQIVLSKSHHIYTVGV